MKRLAVVGCGGHGQDVADIAADQGFNPVFYDSRVSYPQVMGRPDELTGELPVVVAVNDPAVRKRLARSVRGVAVSLVHSSAVVSPSAMLGEGVVVGAGATVGPWCVLGDHCHVGAGASLTRSTFGDFCAISPGVLCAGDVTVGEGVLLGVGSVVRNLTVIGAHTVVGAGAVVVDHVPGGVTVAGVPARRLERHG